MIAKRDTKGMFANELESMMERMPLSKVRARDLCARCGVERRVFSYRGQHPAAHAAGRGSRRVLAPMASFSIPSCALFEDGSTHARVRTGNRSRLQ